MGWGDAGGRKTPEREETHIWSVGPPFPSVTNKGVFKQRKRGGENLKLKATVEETINTESGKLSAALPPPPGQHSMSLTLCAPIHRPARITWGNLHRDEQHPNAVRVLPATRASLGPQGTKTGVMSPRPRGMPTGQRSRLSPGPKSIHPRPSSDTGISQRGWSCFEERLGS